MLRVVSIGLMLFFLLSTQTTIASTTPSSSGNAKYQAWIEEMKQAPRGPFERIRWFCKDGSVLPPDPYACEKRGGGSQHGEWNQQAKQLRADGYYIANFMAGMEPDTFLALPNHQTRFKHILLEQFLLLQDDGWIMRKARFYRGAFQEEGERNGARDLLQTLSGKTQWTGQLFPMLRIGAQLLPHGADNATVQKVRQLSATLSESDPAFTPLRNRIHGRLNADHATMVRDYATKQGKPDLQDKYAELAQDITKIFQQQPLQQRLQQYARKLPAANGQLKQLLEQAITTLNSDKSNGSRHTVTAQLMVALRDALAAGIGSGSLRLATLDLSISLENEHFVAATKLRDQLSGSTRQLRLLWLQNSIDALYGSGLIGQRQRDAMHASIQRLSDNSIALQLYKQELDYLSRLPGWGAQGLEMHFREAMTKFAEIEPLTNLFVQDRLRGSPLLFFSNILDSLLKDANQLAGVQHHLLGEEIGGGLHGLNPGLSRGILHTSTQLANVADFAADGIYLLPETVSDLPPVAGILTLGEGNPLSHVQLLARNLGIPNVAIDSSLQSRLTPYDGKPVVLAVSPAGSVRLELDSGQWDEIFGQEQMGEDAVIRPDLEKLDLEQRALLPLSALRATDSGRSVGPKAAKLGELKHHYPQAVAEGLAIPFGVFRDLLEQPMAGENKSVFAWMVEQYAMLRKLPADSVERQQATDKFRQRLQNWIRDADPGDEFRTKLASAMQQAFGNDGSYGVFVRSDTNVEDLAGFTGAGLNLTVPNVVGFNNILAAISRVWASPFSARAYAWRQSHMELPQHVYPAVLLLRSVPADKSGVMVTQDIDSGDAGWLSVAVNEGVGGAVDGQAAESLRINTENGQVRLLAQATASIRRKPLPEGGVSKLPVSGADTVLLPAEIEQLITLHKELPERFPSVVNDRGKIVPADIEFGFLDGKLKLFQIRPFLESKRARGSAFLNQMDQGLKKSQGVEVSMLKIPTVGSN